MAEKLTIEWKNKRLSFYRWSSRRFWCLNCGNNSFLLLLYWNLNIILSFLLKQQKRCEIAVIPWLLLSKRICTCLRLRFPSHPLHFVFHALCPCLFIILCSVIRFLKNQILLFRMGGLFSKKSKPPTPVQNCEITEQDQAILVSSFHLCFHIATFQQLKTQRDKMKQFIKRKEKCLEKERELAKELIREGKKESVFYAILSNLWFISKALLLLKKKRFQENVIDQTLQQLNQIERMVSFLRIRGIFVEFCSGKRSGICRYTTTSRRRSSKCVGRISATSKLSSRLTTTKLSSRLTTSKLPSRLLNA